MGAVGTRGLGRGDGLMVVGLDGGLMVGLVVIMLVNWQVMVGNHGCDSGAMW